MTNALKFLCCAASIVLLTAVNVLFTWSPVISANVWVLNNGDPDYSNPPFEDSLKLIQPDGTIIMRTGGFNICQTVGGWRAITTTSDGEACWVVEFCGPDSITKIDSQGNRLAAIYGDFTAVDVGPNEDVYALTSNGLIFGESLLVYDSQGNYLRGCDYGGIDLAVDASSNAVWIVGADIKLVDLDLQHQFTIDPIGWTASSVDYAPDGTAWIAERHYPWGGGHNRLLHIAQNSNIIESVLLPISPMCVRVDKDDGCVWATGLNSGPFKYDPDNNQLTEIDTIRSYSLAIDRDLGLIWCGGKYLLKSYARDGQLHAIVDDFLNDDQKFLSIGCKSFTGNEVITENLDPVKFKLMQNFPNPFNASTKIQYRLNELSEISIDIYDLLGRKVIALVNEIQGPGYHQLTWDAGDTPAGVYFYRFQAGDYIETKKMLLLK